jgi:hypothetical protein
MDKLIKPMPKSALHNYNDDVLKELLNKWREEIKEGHIDENTGRKFIDDIYKILGYRCALEYIKQYGD